MTVLEAYEVWGKYNLDTLNEAAEHGRDFALLFVGHMSVVSPEKAGILCRRHTIHALESLTYLRGELVGAPYVDETIDDQRSRIEELWDLPQILRQYLDPVFSRPDVFDPNRKYEKRFTIWESKYLGHFSLALPSSKKMSIEQDYDNSINTFSQHVNEVKTILEDMLEEMGC